jgi:hypothetical protein
VYNFTLYFLAYTEEEPPGYPDLKNVEMRYSTIYYSLSFTNPPFFWAECLAHFRFGIFIFKTKSSRISFILSHATKGVIPTGKLKNVCIESLRSTV